MLTIDQIKKAYSEEVFIKNPRAVLVEYLQHEILDSIYKQPGSENLSFIGGTAIRIVYESKRFSEDLDFDNFGLSYSDFKDLLGKVVLDMEAKGFEIEFRFVEKGAYHCYIKFPEILQNSGLAVHEEEKMLIRIDTVSKNKIAPPEVFTLSRFDVYRNILVNPQAVILSQKMIAILERKREKGRDFYDVSFLLGRTSPDYEYLEKMKGIKKSELKDILLKKADSINMDDMLKDVSPFLIDKEDKERILGFRKYIEQKLG
jgi:predicted nucleotidyltransferase component of viral defense system